MNNYGEKRAAAIVDWLFCFQYFPGLTRTTVALSKHGAARKIGGIKKLIGCAVHFSRVLPNWQRLQK
jgi:hypothetical protein